MSRNATEEESEIQGPSEAQESGAMNGKSSTAEPDALNLFALSRYDLEKKIRGAMRRSRMPGKHGKQGAKDLVHYKNVHKKRFPGLSIRLWDSLPPPPRNKNPQSSS